MRILARASTERLACNVPGSRTLRAAWRPAARAVVVSSVSSVAKMSVVLPAAVMTTIIPLILHRFVKTLGRP